MKRNYFSKKLFGIILLILFFFTFSVSCTQKSFVCWNEEETEAIAFAFDSIVGYAVVEDIHDFYILNAEKQLNSDMPGGSHTLQMDQNTVVLEFIQDTVYTKTKLPSGQFIKDSSEIKNRYDYLNQRRYHAVYPVVHKYVFDKKLLKLSLFYSPLPKPRSAIEQEFIYDKTRNNLYPKKVKDLTQSESASIFPPHEKTSTFLYPKCKNETYSLKRILRTILGYLIFP